MSQSSLAAARRGNAHASHRGRLRWPCEAKGTGGPESWRKVAVSEMQFIAERNYGDEATGAALAELRVPGVSERGKARLNAAAPAVKARELPPVNMQHNRYCRMRPALDGTMLASRSGQMSNPGELPPPEELVGGSRFTAEEWRARGVHAARASPSSSPAVAGVDGSTETTYSHAARKEASSSME